MRKLVLAFALGSALFLLGGSSALADTMPAPADGPAFGQHVATIAPGTGATMTGADFGGCVSTMAALEVCSCPCPCPAA